MKIRQGLPTAVYGLIAITTFIGLMFSGCGGGGSDAQESSTSPSDNTAPVADMADPTIADLTIYLDAGDSYDPDDDGLDYFWHFGDGQSAGGQTIYHTYAGPGTYEVVLVVTDEHNSEDQIHRFVTVGGGNSSPGGPDECEDWQQNHPEWIFCDNFEDTGPLRAEGRYFEYADDDGEFVAIDGVGVDGSRGMRARFQAGEVEAGSLKLAFGRNPSGYMNQNIRPNEDFREIYYRMYLRMQAGWQGNPAKLSRATSVADDDFSQAMIAHIWGGQGNVLAIDPVRCVDTDDQFKCIGYNDFDHMDWIGLQHGQTPIFAPGYDDQWYCIEAHVKLNDPGQQNGIHEFWIDGELEARDDHLDFVRGYSEYGINAVFFENWWNSGSPIEQERYFDNIVVSTAPIGCLADSDAE